MPSRPVTPFLKGIEYVNCNLCGANDTQLVFKLPVWMQHAGQFNRDEWDIARCRRCGLVYENPRPDAETIGYYYEFNNAGDYDYLQNWFINSADLDRALCQPILRAMRRYLSLERLLEVGCGAIIFLVEARQTGFNVVGENIAPFFVKYDRKEPGLTILDGELDELGLESANIDCITAFDVIEHEPHLRRLLNEMHRLLKPGGLVIIITHDIGNIIARLYHPRWRHMGAIDRLTYFSRATGSDDDSKQDYGTLKEHSDTGVHVHWGK